jgi:hypothetical protein
MANRAEPHLDQTVGWISNTIPFIVPPPAAPIHESLIHAVQDALFEAYDHQMVPFATLLKGLRPDLYFNGLASSHIYFEAAAPEPKQALAFSNCELAVVPIDSGFAPSGLSFSARVGIERMDFEIRYEAGRYGDPEIQQLGSTLAAAGPHAQPALPTTDPDNLLSPPQE